MASRPPQLDGLVSTIIPVHNRPAMQREAVVSVLDQTYRPIEIIVVDDGSTDETGAVAEAMAAAHPGVVTALHIANGGPGAAREAGRQVAQGEFIQYLDSDDLLEKRKFELQVGTLRDHPHCGVAYGKTRAYAIGDAPVSEPWKLTGERIATMMPSFLQSRWWDTSTPLYRRDVVDRAGPWTNLRSEEDWEYDSRVGSQRVRLAYVDAFVSDTRFHSGPMLSAGRGTDEVGRLRDRAEAHWLIFHHAQAAGIGINAPEMRHFARELFLLSRQCGAVGLATEARNLFDLAREASGPSRGRGADFVGYRALSSVVGWSLAGRIACALDRLRP